MDWLYEERPFTENENDDYGFIYYIEYECGLHYIGMKAFKHKSTLPALKSGEQRPNSLRIGKNKNGKRVYYDVVYKDSDWRTYFGSSKLTEGLIPKAKHIMHLCRTKRNMTYMEAKLLFLNEVLEDESFVNDNILGKFYKGRLE